MFVIEWIKNVVKSHVWVWQREGIKLYPCSIPEFKVSYDLEIHVTLPVVPNYLR